ncbi:hypothetical protein ZWY2020_056601 [Hordeum vulgare]|nr:hypothetical protein ZWY2020_056601 [Hordeum vulgare]
MQAVPTARLLQQHWNKGKCGIQNHVLHNMVKTCASFYSTIRNSEELRRGTIEQLEKARIRLQKVELEADEYRMNGYSEIEREKANLINAFQKSSKDVMA